MSLHCHHYNLFWAKDSRKTMQLGGKLHNRTWTISSHPDESSGSGHFSISVKKAGLISTWLHEQLSTGSALMWRGAAGEFVPERGTRPVLLIAGGIGEAAHIPCAQGIATRPINTALMMTLHVMGCNGPMNAAT